MEELSTKKAKSSQRMRFFESLFGGVDEAEGFLCLATSDPRAPKATWQNHFYEWPVQALKVENFIIKSERTLNVYFCPTLLTKRERKKDNCMPTDLLWADLDTANPDLIMDYPPPIVLRTSPGRWQALWRVQTKLDPFMAQDYSRRLAHQLGADKSGWDLGQVLRVPYTVNWKYNTPVGVELQRFSELRLPAMIFEQLPATFGLSLVQGEPGIPTDQQFDQDQVIFKYRPLLEKTSFFSLYTQDPPEDANWSGIFWRMLHDCLRVGMSLEETFVVAREAKCNKYARDGRPLEHMWRDVLKAGDEYQHVDLSSSLIRMPTLIEENDPRITPTFLDTYREWATEATDAVSGFHDISMLVVLSAIVSMSVKLETSAGLITPNIWGLILGDSTLTRKTTAMRMAMDFLITIDPSLIVATDGTAEGLLSGLAGRPNRASIFYKDEVSGLFDSMGKKDYMAGLQETFTALYDVPPITLRTLRKETIVIESPAFVFLCGGVPDRIYSSIDESFVLSGFLPRFLVVSGDARVEDRRPLGPPTEGGKTKKPAILNVIADLFETYATDTKQKIGKEHVLMPPRIVAHMTNEAWALNSEIETLMLNAGSESLVRDLALPTMDRMSRSIMKIGVILAAIRQKPQAETIIVEEFDIVNAANLVQEWGQNSIDLVVSAGKGHHEKFLERVHEFINGRPGVLKSSIMQRFHMNSKDAAIIIQTLEERAMIRREARGRGSAYWAI